MPPEPNPQPRALYRSGRFLIGLGLGLLVLAASFADAALRSRAEAPRIAGRSELVAVLGLTDLSLFTEARYTRHPSQADLHSAFQDHPLSLEHFPSGSLVPPMVPGAPR
ncbi:MAG: hypothetical protein MUC77_17495 [Chromatiaceae bacterium]|nr:hypothetical protein [Chromatiaceae bacterium]